MLLAPNGFDPVVPADEPPVAPLAGVHDVVYVGNMGLATGLDVVLDAAALLRDEPIRFVLVGAGADAERLRARAANERLANVVFTGSLPRPGAMRALHDCALTVVPLVASITDSLPTKLFDAMQSARPSCSARPARRAARRTRRRRHRRRRPATRPRSPTRSARVAADAALRERFAANGRAFVTAHYDRAAVMRDFAARIGSLTAR